MERTLVCDLRKQVGNQVLVTGWVQAVRNQKKMQFVVLRDHTGSVQVLHARVEGDDPIGTILQTVSVESVVRLTGMVIENAQVKLGGIEIEISEVEVVSAAEVPLPITEETQSDIKLDWRFLDLRTPANRLIFETQTVLEQGMREFWAQNNFLEVHSPKLMAGASESGAELFRLDYFGGNAYLAQSPQFYKQMAMAAGFDRIFEIGPVFRADPSFTSRHNTEFTSVDVEVSWVDSHEDVMVWEERLLQFAIGVVADKFGDRIKETFGLDVVVPTVPFPRIPMAEVYEILRCEMGYEVTHAQKGDLDPEGERKIGEYVKKEFGHEFVFVTDYPVSARPFYHMRHEGDPTLTMSFDLLWKGLEVTSGAQREHRHDQLRAQAIEKGLTPESIQYYLDFFRFGCPPHGGFGFGLARGLMLLLGRSNIREVTYLPRGPKRLTP